MNKPAETKPWAKLRVIEPSIPCIELLNAAIKYTAACDTEE